MRYLAILAILMLAAVPAIAGMVRLGDEVEMPVSEGWEVLGDSSSYPFLLMASDKQAELLLFKSTIDQDGSIDDQAALKASVDRVIDSVILTLPEAKMLTSSGYSGGDNVRFILEFTSQDQAENTMVRHRMMGVLYRTENGNQDLFTLWGRAAFADYPAYEEALVGMQRDFRFVGEHASEVFMASTNSRMLSVGAPILLVIALVALLHIRQRQKLVKPRRVTAIWVCGCGTENDARETFCQFCGQRSQLSRIR
jgi:hypothetical protein